MIRKILYALLTLLILFFAILEFGNLTYGVSKDKAIAVGYFSAALYTFVFGFLLRRRLQPYIVQISNQKLAFTLIGTVGAIFVETVVWVAQVYFKATGAAIHPNLLVDLLMTVPFYTLLCYFVAKWVIQLNFSWPMIAVTGGIYETGADGIVGNLIQLNFLGALISPVLIPVFMITYSPIILVPFLLAVRTVPTMSPAKKNYMILLKPLLALLILPLSIGAGLLLGEFVR